ncbi:MAG: type II secretion system GspH family protein [Verrucomicrobiaceae bacterium]|nr:type II secretion system GspH family protein [Verrucomicrobiaceae bacterium]
MKTSRKKRTRPFHGGFTLVEAVITIAVVGIMASLVVSGMTNLSRDSQRIVGRQQQAAVQNAINAWVMSKTRVESSPGVFTSQVMSINDIRSLYNGQSTAKGKFETFLAPNATTGLGGFLDVTTSDHIKSYTTNNQQLKTSALDLAKQHLELPTWTAGAFPKVDLVND